MVASVPVSAGSTPTEAPTTAPAPAPAPTSPGDCGLVDLQAQVLADLNRHRAAGANCGTKGLYGPATAVTWNALLETAALRHSQDMADKNYFSHVSANGNTLQQRIDATGYAWMGIGENIAASYGSVSDVVTAWIDSDGHCANMMNPNFAEIGLACVRGTSATTYRNYWTLNFGTPPKKAQSSAR
jgi:uncharacterized protein YkwD